MKENTEQNDHQMWTVATQAFISSQNNISAFDNANSIFFTKCKCGTGHFLCLLTSKRNLYIWRKYHRFKLWYFREKQIKISSFVIFLNFWRILADSGVWNFLNLFSVLYFFVGKQNIIFLSFSFLMPYVLSSESVVVNSQVYLA